MIEGNLTKELRQMSKENDKNKKWLEQNAHLKDTNAYKTVQSQVNSVDNANLGAESVIENCTECGIKFEKLEVVNVTGVHIKDGQPLAVVRDHLNIKHWFVLNKNLSLI